MTTSNNEKKPQISEVIVIPDECGDTLWDDVLAQRPDLTTIINKPADSEADQAISDTNGEPTKP
jgi:hypothetical protein